MSIKKDNDCIFCKIIEGNIPSYTVYEDDECKAILDVSPAARGHVIILPKEHASDIFELSEDMASKIFVVAKKIATALMGAFSCEGINIIQNNGEVAGQTVFHLHVHVIPRYQGDSIRIQWGQNKVKDMDIVVDEIKRAIAQ